LVLWGKQRYAQNITPTGYRYTAQRFDDKLGLYDYQARYYDPHIGRFISADTIIPGSANPQAFNRYAYVFNSPLVYVDPDGHRPQSVTFRFQSGTEMRKAVRALSVAYTDYKRSADARPLNLALAGGGIGATVAGAYYGTAGTVFGGPPGGVVGIAAGILGGGALGAAIGYGAGRLWNALDPVLNDLGKIAAFLNTNVVLHADNRLEIRINATQSIVVDELTINLRVESRLFGTVYYVVFVFTTIKEDGTITVVRHEIEISYSTYWLLRDELEKASLSPVDLDPYEIPVPPTPPVTPVSSIPISPGRPVPI
jgi:RHS repeat-associated protein